MAVAGLDVFWRPADIIPIMDENLRNQIMPGAQVKVTQQIAARDYSWASEVRGEVVSFKQKPTGSWYAHSKNDKLWLDRLVLRKTDGEITTLNLDEYTHVEIEKAGAAAAGTGTEESEG
jgi:hypothetical protein